MKKHYHIEIEGTYSVLANSVEEAIEKVESWFEKADTMPYVGETDDNDHCDYCPVLPDGLQKYMDGVALNILYRNYHKSTNGIWSRAEVEECVEDDHGEYFIVNVDFGCQDDTRNESYRDTIYIYYNGKEWRVNHTIPAQRDKEKV